VCIGDFDKLFLAISCNDGVTKNIVAYVKSGHMANIKLSSLNNAQSLQYVRNMFMEMPY